MISKFLLHIRKVDVTRRLVVLPEFRELEDGLQDALDLAIPWKLALPVSFGGALICSNLLLELFLKI